MKKRIFSLILLTATFYLVSCSKEEFTPPEAESPLKPLILGDWILTYYSSVRFEGGNTKPEETRYDDDREIFQFYSSGEGLYLLKGAGADGDGWARRPFKYTFKKDSIHVHDIFPPMGWYKLNILPDTLKLITYQEKPIKGSDRPDSFKAGVRAFIRFKNPVLNSK